MQMVKCHDAKQEDIFFLIFDELRDIEIVKSNCFYNGIKHL